MLPLVPGIQVMIEKSSMENKKYYEVFNVMQIMSKTAVYILMKDCDLHLPCSLYGIISISPVQYHFSCKKK